MAVAEPAADNTPWNDIMAAGRRLIERGGGFTTKEVISEAEVALQTFYRYFGGKDQLILALITDVIQEFCDGLKSAAAGLDDPLERLETYVRRTLRAQDDPRAQEGGRFITTEHWRLHQLFPEEMSRATRPLTELLRAELVAAQEAGSITCHTPDDHAWVINKILMSRYHHASFAPDDPSMATVDAIWDFCLAAVGGDVAHSRRRGPIWRRR